MLILLQPPLLEQFCLALGLRGPSIEVGPRLVRDREVLFVAHRCWEVLFLQGRTKWLVKHVEWCAEVLLVWC